jgi:hypothetical protein
VLRRTTASRTATELFLDGDSATQRLTLAGGRTMTFDILIVARTDAGDWLVYREPGGAALVTSEPFDLFGTPGRLLTVALTLGP